MSEIAKGIAAYAHEQKVILRVLRKHGALSAKEFDRIFGDFKWQIGSDGVHRPHFRRLKVRFCPVTSDAFILGGLEGGDWAKWLNLTQLMAQAGLIKIYKRDGEIHYRAATK